MTELDKLIKAAKQADEANFKAREALYEAKAIYARTCRMYDMTYKANAKATVALYEARKKGKQ